MRRSLPSCGSTSKIANHSSSTLTAHLTCRCRIFRVTETNCEPRKVSSAIATASNRLTRAPSTPASRLHSLGWTRLRAISTTRPLCRSMRTACTRPCFRLLPYYQSPIHWVLLSAQSQLRREASSQAHELSLRPRHLRQPLCRALQETWQVPHVHSLQASRLL